MYEHLSVDWKEELNTNILGLWGTTIFHINDVLYKMRFIEKQLIFLYLYRFDEKQWIVCISIFLLIRRIVHWDSSMFPICTIRLLIEPKIHAVQRHLDFEKKS